MTSLCPNGSATAQHDQDYRLSWTVTNHLNDVVFD